MKISATVKDYLEGLNISYELISHKHSTFSTQTAELSHVSGNSLAKSILLKDEVGRVMAIIPASRMLIIDELNRYLGRNLQLCQENDLNKLFVDCERGAIPALGKAYGIETITDESLHDCDDIYFEAGNHTELIHMSGVDFRHLNRDSLHGQFSHHL